MSEESSDTRARAARGKSGRRALGRGLDALLPPVETGARELPVDRIEPNPTQPRKRFERKSLEELAASIKTHGLVQPLVVTAIDDDRYRLIVGERRWQAARLAGLERVPVIVKESDDRQTLEVALIENLQREDLNPLEEAAAYQRLLQEYGLTQAEVAERVGKSRVAVANTLRLLALPHEIQTAVVEESITEGHARALLGLADRAQQAALAREIADRDLSVRETEERVRSLSEPKVRTGVREKPVEVASLEDEFRRALGFKVALRQGRRGGGRIVIEYSSEEEFETLYDRLVGST